MTRWLLAAVLAIAGAWIAYGPLRRGRPVVRGLPALGLGALRAGAYLCLLAMLLGAPAGPPILLAPLPILDVSASWQRGDDGSSWRAALDSLSAMAGDSVLLVGDSSRIVSRTEARDLTPRDVRTRLQPALDQATALGRAVAVITDGEFDDPAVLPLLPAGSRVVRIDGASRPDLAVASLEVPVYATGGDTIDVQATLTAGNTTVEGGTLAAALEDGVPVRVTVTPLEAFASRRLTLRLPLPRGAGVRRLTVAVSGTNDIEPRNDSLTASLDLSDRPRVLFVSTAPDLDVREVLRVLRGTVMLPVRAYLRLAPGVWREEGTLAPVSEAQVQQHAREAGLLVLHGDTAWSGIAAARRGASLLWAPAPPPAPPRAGELSRPVEWFASGAPPSPISAVLEGLPFDSLAPLELGAPLEGGVALLEARAGRTGTPRVVAAVAGGTGSRQIRVAGSGFAGWALRGGRPADAFTAWWGAIFDWLAVAEGDGDGAWIAGGVVRAGEPLRWRRGGGDSVQLAVLTVAGGETDSVTLRFDGGADLVETAPLAEGTYRVQVGGRSRSLAVNPSREWVPRAPAPTPVIPAVGAPSVPARPLLERMWPFVLALVLLSLEWFARRGVGLR